MSKLPYFEQEEAITGSTESILEAIANRFIGSHPKRLPVYRTHSRRGFHKGADYRYEMNLEERWPALGDGQFVYVWGRLWRDEAGESPFSISCFAPAKVFINAELAFASNLNDDVLPDKKSYFHSKLRKGWNDIVLEFVRTGTGCGGLFGTGSVKGAPMHILAPGRKGQEGWIYSEPQSTAWTVFPDEKTEGSDSALTRWFPEVQWSRTDEERGCFGRLFGMETGYSAYAWSKLVNDSFQSQQVTVQGEYKGALIVYLNGMEVYRSEGETGKLEAPVSVPFGSHELVVQSASTGSGSWDMRLAIASPAGDSVMLTKPYPVEGLEDVWMYLGPFENELLPNARDITRVDTVFGEAGAETFWRVDQPDMWVRPFLENGMYGKWNYPLGVTLYGILQTGVELSSPHFSDYAADHIEQCTSMNRYSLWDREQYGAPGINHQLTLIDSLDDCGSFGAAMLEAHKIRQLRDAEAAAERISSYITYVQDRLPDGTLYRARGTTDFMKDTMWCDDLYMSTPFLCKYYELTGDIAYLDDAVQQFLLYKERLYRPDKKMMHHVYDFKFNKPNGVAWGRGNGWVLFSLTELLAVMPEDYRLRPAILSFYRELCEGYASLQGEHGLWHQVLTDPESYEEASCTSMFIYAFARGVRYGWLDNAELYASAVLRGWKGLTSHCIDKHGHVYGVCRGSGYSFSALYYKDELTWQLDDTHGIGIILLAGIETLRLRNFYKEEKVDKRSRLIRL